MAAAFAAAHAVVELDLKLGRHSGVPLETRGAIAHYDAARDMLALYGAAKVPHWNRDALARMLGRAHSAVHLHEGHTGGGFGVRGELYPEDVLACLGALRLGGVVKWIEDRREHLLATNHSRQQHYRVRAAVDEDGRLLAIDGDFFHDQGAYARTHAATVPDLAATMLLGPYRVAAYRMAGVHPAHQQNAVRHLPRAGTFREHIRARAAARCHSSAPADRSCRSAPPQSDRRDRDALCARARHARHRNDLRFRRLRGLLDKALAALSWQDLRADLERRRAAGETVGAGFAMFVEKSGLGPYDGVHATIDTSGAVEIVTGATSVGQGMETVLAQICADALGVDYRAVRLVHGQTDRIAYGMGTFASRVTVMTGEATRRRRTQLRAKAIAAAAGLLQTAPEALDVIDGKVVRKNAAQGPSISLGDVARALDPGSKLVGEAVPGLSAEGFSNRGT